MNKTKFDPLVLISPAITMQRIQQSVSHGYRYWISGRVSAVKAQNMVNKFDGLWNINIDKNQRYRQRQKGVAVFSLFLYPVDNSKSLDWILIRTGGTHPELDREQWLDIYRRDTRLHWRGYELIKLPLTKNERNRYVDRNPNIGTETLTWRMTRECYESWKKRIRSSVNTYKRTKGQNPQPYNQMLHSLSGAPGFRGVRRQVFQLRMYVNECRCRCKLPPEQFNQAIKYMQPRKCSEHPLSVLIRRAQNGEETWFPPRTNGRGIMTRISE